jgi:hypothetical protein
MDPKRLAAIAALGAGLVATSAAGFQQPQPTGLPNIIVRDAKVDGRRLAIVTDDWLYCYPPTRELIVVPKGYVTDFASVPSAARGVIDVYGSNIEGAVVHDWLYAVGEPGKRDKADQVIRYALMEQDVGVVRRNTVYMAVRSGGSAAYGRATEWDKRFGDPATGQILAKAPYRRRATAVVAVLPQGCGALENPQRLQELRRIHSSAAWPRAE